MKKPLEGIKVLELAGLAPAPFCGLVLSDFGAEVVRIDRKETTTSTDTLCRGKRSICLDLKNKEGAQVLLELLKKADVLIDPFRPKVLEKLGLSPQICMQANPRLIIARLTGYGQTGIPLKKPLFSFICINYP